MVVLSHVNELRDEKNNNNNNPLVDWLEFFFFFFLTLNYFFGTKKFVMLLRLVRASPSGRFKRLCIWKNIDQSSIVCANWFGYPHLPSPSAGVPTAVHMETSQYLWRRRVENPFATYARRLAMCTNTYAHPSFPRWTCHAGCAYAYANFAQAVQISKICTVEASTVHFFFHMHRIFHPMDLRFSRYVQIFHMHSHRWRWSNQTKGVFF